MPDQWIKQMDWKSGDWPVPTDKYHDISWLSSPEGWKWAMDQQPEGKPIPWKTAELQAINRRLWPFVRKHYPGTTPPSAGGVLVPSRVRSLLSRDLEDIPDKDFMRGYREWMLWQMPYKHTMERSHLNNYWHWYRNIRPGHHSWNLAELKRAEELYKICRAICNERKAIRLAGLRK